MLIIVLYDKGKDTGVTQGSREEGSEENHLNKRKEDKSSKKRENYVQMCRGIKTRNSIKSSGNSKLLNKRGGEEELGRVADKT